MFNLKRQLVIRSEYSDLENYLFNRVTKRFARRQTLTSFDFYVIVTWKSNRSIGNVKAGLKKAHFTPTKLMSRISRCATDKDKMNMLIKIGGIGVPIASAILTVCYPRRFTILDYRAWEALRYFQRVERKTVPLDVDSYFRIYLPECLKLAKQLGLTFRQLDRALWGWSKRKSLI